MRVSGSLITPLRTIPDKIREIEAAGYDTAYSAEINNDPFFPLLLAAEHSERVHLTTAIAVAFARSPMTLALQAWDLNQYAGGRFSVGLGSQIRAHITKRYSMPWSQPAARMREFIRAMRAIWTCWETGEKLDFRGEFYRHTLMTPMFTPSLKEAGAPQVRLAAVGPKMTEVAGEVADGLIAHAFTTEKYLEEVTIPALQRGFAKAGRRRGDFDLSAPVFVVSGDDETAFEKSKTAVKAQLAFYGSTPPYRPVLDLHGWGELQTELNRLSKEGRWADMGELISDDILATLAIVTEDPGEIPDLLHRRYGRFLDTWVCTYEMPDSERQRELLRRVQKSDMEKV